MLVVIFMPRVGLLFVLDVEMPVRIGCAGGHHVVPCREVMRQPVIESRPSHTKSLTLLTEASSVINRQQHRELL
jgi:hypothetical protein